MNPFLIHRDDVRRNLWALALCAVCLGFTACSGGPDNPCATVHCAQGRVCVAGTCVAEQKNLDASGYHDILIVDTGNDATLNDVVVDLPLVDTHLDVTKPDVSDIKDIDIKDVVSEEAVCSSETCSGCCDLDGKCVAGNLVSACGKGGEACNTCAENYSCTSGACQPPCAPSCSNKRCGDADGCGGTCQEGSGCCGKTTCPNGCCRSTGTCSSGSSNTNCGDNGDACSNCSTVGQICSKKTCTTCIPSCSNKRCGDSDGCGGTCQEGSGCCGSTSCPDGCCDSNGQCQPGNSTSACGKNGSACESCSFSYTCLNQTCTYICVPNCPACWMDDGCGSVCYCFEP